MERNLEAEIAARRGGKVIDIARARSRKEGAAPVLRDSETTRYAARYISDRLPPGWEVGICQYCYPTVDRTKEYQRTPVKKKGKLRACPAHFQPKQAASE